MEQRNRHGDGNRRGAPRAKPEFDQKTLAVRRVTRVVAGGRRFSFSVALVAGDRHGRVGIGLGKGSDTSLAVDKAYRQAKKKMISLPLKAGTIPHEVSAKFCGSQVVIRPAPGRGLVAGSAVRIILDLAGVRDVSAKITSRSKNRLNNAKATLNALNTLNR